MPRWMQLRDFGCPLNNCRQGELYSGFVGQNTSNEAATLVDIE